MPEQSQAPAMIDLPPRPQPPPTSQVRDELGIPAGTPNGRKLLQGRRKHAPSMIAYEQALADWMRETAPVREEIERREAAERAEWRRLMDLRTREEREAQDALIRLWAGLPCRWRKQRAYCQLLLGSTVWTVREVRGAIARLAVEVTATALLRRGWGLEHRSSSGTIYLQKSLASDPYLIRLRLSDHELGYGDYGTRRQVHRGPELVFGGTEAPGDAVDLAEITVEEWLEEMGHVAHVEQDASRVPGL
jgi:hypothetical protein